MIANRKRSKRADRQSHNVPSLRVGAASRWEQADVAIKLADDVGLILDEVAEPVTAEEDI